MTSRSSRFDLAPLAHPLWWAALALLVINDNLLKGHGVVPGWLTGKLSDFAFLVVAPVVFAAMLPRALPGRRPFAIAAVVGVYVAADLSPPFSDAVVALAARAGLRWRLWPDATDLIALAVLPLTIHLLYRAPPLAAQRARWLRERAGVALGAAACLATSAPPNYGHNPFLFNATGATAAVQVTWVLRDVGDHDCTAPEVVAATLNANDLDDPRDLTLTSGQVAALDGPIPAAASPVGVCSTETGWRASQKCVAAILTTPSAQPVLMVAQGRWREYESSAFIQCSSPPAPVSLCAPMLDPARDAGPDALTLKVVDGQPRFVAGDKLRIVAIDPAAIAARTPDPNGCRGLRDRYRSLIANSTCATNADCTGRMGLAAPAEPSACGVHVNAAANTMIDDLARMWAAACLSETPACDGYPQPAACRNGRCEAACPGVDVPRCPSPCSNPDRTLSATACDFGYTCIGTDGKHCGCVDGGESCIDPPPAAPGCPLACVDYPGGGSLSAPAPDAGAGD